MHLDLAHACAAAVIKPDPARRAPEITQKALPDRGALANSEGFFAHRLGTIRADLRDTIPDRAPDTTPPKPFQKGQGT